MPAKSPHPTETAARQLQALGKHIRARRKALGVNAVALAEAAKLSRVTVHRIEKGYPNVTMGAYLAVMQALGLGLEPLLDAERNTANELECLPLAIPPARYPVLESLAWQIGRHHSLTPAEALDIYERNSRHVEEAELQVDEQALIAALRQVFHRDDGRAGV